MKRHRLLHDPLAIASLLTLAVLYLTALVGPLVLDRINGNNGTASSEDVPTDAIALQPPSPKHWFGTDHLGRDLFTRLITSGRYSLPIGLIVIACAIVISVPLGATAGFAGGWLDDTIMRVTDIFLAVPQMLLSLALAMALGAGFGTLVIALVISWWPWYVRLMRAQALAIREREYVIASQALGASWIRVLWRHIVPNGLTPLLVQATSDVGAAILTAGALSFLGVGIQSPATDWGQLVSDGRLYFPDRWWYATFPGAAIFITALAFGLLGDALHTAIDPRLSARRG